jgi:hypothetical protein
MIKDGGDAAPEREIARHRTTVTAKTATQACMYYVTIKFPCSRKNYLKFEM